MVQQQRVVLQWSPDSPQILLSCQSSSTKVGVSRRNWQRLADAKFSAASS